MNVLTPAELLSVWERGYAQSPPARAVLLLAAADPRADACDLLAIPVGRRDEQLLSFREQTFGREFTGVTECVECAEPVELKFSSDDVRAAVLPLDETSERPADARLPDTRDLLAIADAGEEHAEAVLRARCAGSDAAAQWIEKADPMAVVRLTIGCPACGRVFARLFDVVAFLWSEIDAWAVRLAREVHLLASAYGWSERDILAMSTWRRQMYVELVQ